MSQKLLLAWAISATALMLVAMGFAMGKSAGRAPTAGISGSVYVLPDVDTGSDRATAPDTHTPRYAVPTEFDGLPREWRTEHDNALRGYAILLDPARRELIVEQCQHAGYINSDTGEPVPQGWEFCRGALRGVLAQFSAGGALAIDSNGQPVEVTMTLGGDEVHPQLLLAFAEHSMTLIPGSKNDLLQAVEAEPEIRRQKLEWIRQTLAAEDTRRTPADKKADLPRYTMPGGDDSQDAGS